MKHLYYSLGAWVLSWAIAAGFGTWFAAVEHISTAHGIYWATTTVETVGYGDIAPHTGTGYWIAEFTMLLGIPMWGLTFGLFTSWLTSLHIWDAHEQLKQHVSDQMGNGAS